MLRLSSIRGPIVVGFAIVFALWLASVYELVRSMREAEQQMASARRAFARAEQVLTTVTTRVLLGSIYLRDALLTQTPEIRDRYRSEIAQIRAEVDEILPSYTSLIDTPQERTEWERLQVELDRYWQSRELAFIPTLPAEPAAAAAAAERIRLQIVPARESILEIVSSLSALERSSIENHEREGAQFYQQAQTHVLWLSALALVTGVLVAVVAARHVGRLEREIDRQQVSDRQNRRDLERLSARLVHAQEEERRSLARELHDAVGQALTAIKMEVGVALRGTEADFRSRTALEQARTIAETTLQTVRDLSQLLHPSMLDDFGLPEALRGHLKGFSRRTGIRADFMHERMEERLSPEIELCVYRITQEALTNVARHSGASSCTVSLIRRDDSLHLTIEDDGRGLGSRAPSADTRRGLGLIGMRERAQTLAGSFEIDNRPEGGTRVVVKLPVIAAVTVSPVQQMAG